MMERFFELSRQFIAAGNKDFRRYFLEKNDFSHRFNIISGQRGVGKSTAMIQILAEYSKGDLFSNKILYVPSDHFLVAGSHLYTIAEEFYKLGGEFICFDEIHKYKEWSMELKSIYDSFPDLKIIASGSSALEIHKGTHDLSRRAIVYKIDGLSFREFLTIRENVDLNTVTVDEILKDHEKLSFFINETLKNKNIRILPSFYEYLRIGFYPYFLQFKEENLMHIMLEQNIHTSIESDLTSVYSFINGETVRKIKKLLAVVASLVPYTPDLNSLKEICGVSDHRTLKTYLSYIEDAGIISQYQKSGNEMDSLRKPEKIYLNNTAQMYAISPDNSKNIGNIRETFFSQAVSPVHKLRIPKKGDFEIDGDLIVEIGGKSKKTGQLDNLKKSIYALDEINSGFKNKIPLWLFGFLY
jgi:predicted AAA+ superfamily ATPase